MVFDLSELSDLGTFIIGAVGVAGLLWGLWQYRQAKGDKRKEDFFQLAKEFDTSVEMYFAKKILDQWGLDYSKEKGLFTHESGPFHIGTLKWILAEDYDTKLKYEAGHDEFCKGKTDEEKFEAWQKLRDSFDLLFSFFERVAYLYNNNRVKEKELRYFTGYIDNAIDNQDVKKFLDAWGYKWHKDLKSILKKMLDARKNLENH